MQLPHDLDPVDPRQHQVEDDEIGTMEIRQAQRLGPVGGTVGLVSRPLHVATDDVEDCRLVVDHQHGPLRGLGHRHHCRGPAANRR